MKQGWIISSIILFVGSDWPWNMRDYMIRGWFTRWQVLWWLRLSPYDDESCCWDTLHLQASNSFYITSVTTNTTHLLFLIKEIFIANTLSYCRPCVWTWKDLNSSLMLFLSFLVVCHEGTSCERSLNPIFMSFKVSSLRCVWNRSAFRRISQLN